MSDDPMLAAITLTPKGDGVGAVAGLLLDAVRRRSGSCSVVTMFEGPARRPSLSDKVAFATGLNRRMLLEQPRWMLFSHMGLTRAMRFVPPRLRRPYAVFLHGTEVWQPLREADQELLGGAALRLANSCYTARRAMQTNPAIGPVVACPLALPDTNGQAKASTPSIASLPSRLNDPQTLVVLVVGALRSEDRYKGHDELIAAWPSVVAAVPHAHLLIVGDGDDRTRLQEVVNQNAARQTISLLGFVDQKTLTVCYERAALFAMPSRGEGFGLVYLEAMAHRLPCIGSRQDAAGEVIADGVTGVLVDQHERDELAAAIVSLLDDPDRRHAMGLAGHARLQAEFTIPAFQSRLNAALDRTFPSNARPR